MVSLGFKKTLFITMSVILIVSVSVSNFFSFQSESELLKNMIFSETKRRVDIEKIKVEDYFRSIELAVNNMAKDYQANNYTDRHAERMRVGASGSGVVNLMIGLDSGDSYASFDYPGWHNNKNPDNYDPREKDWYKDAKRNSEVIFTAPYRDAMTKELMVSVAKNFGVGVLLADIPLRMLNDIVSNIELAGSVSFIVADDSSIVASSSELLKVGEKITDNILTSELNRLAFYDNQKMFNYNFNGLSKVFFTGDINYGEKKWKIFIGLDESVIFKPLEEARLSALIITILFVTFGLLFFIIVFNIVYKPILRLRNTIVELSKGNCDLTQRLKVVSSDELGDMADGINKFIENIQCIMIDIEQSSIKLNENVIFLEKKSQENKDILYKHVQETEQVITAIEEMNSTASSVALDAGETAQATRNATDIGNGSLDMVNHAQEKVLELVSEVQRTSNNLKAMTDETKGINDILKVIGEIAEQTNLLALNAAIEAARAGEQGRGFAVVADEVRALASRTQSSTVEIERALSRLLKVSQDVVDSMERTKETCSETSDNADSVGRSIIELTRNICTINDLNSQIATAAEEQSSVTQEVSRNMAALSDIVCELNQNGEYTVKQATDIAMVNEKLVSMVGEFKLR